MPMEQNYSFRMSAAITWLRFPLIFFVVLLHGYSVVQIPGHPLYFKTVYPLALWLGETGVPAFLFISGYLFFLSKKTYTDKLKSRFHSLLIPYLLWNGLLLALYMLAYASGHPQVINGKSMADYSILDYLRVFWDRGTYGNGNFVPLLCPYWYVRNLLILSLLSPILEFLIRYLRVLFLLFLAVWWMLTPHNAFITLSLLFFCAGAYFSISKTIPLQLFCQQRKFFIILAVIAATFDIVSHTFFSTTFNLIFHRVALIANIPALFLMADYAINKLQIAPKLSDTAFFFFSIHYPVIVVLRRASVSFFANAGDGLQILSYAGSIIITTGVSLLVYWFMDMFMTRFKNLLTGNRS